MTLNKFTFEVEYFKLSGKLYIIDNWVVETETLSDSKYPYMYDAIDKLKLLRDQKKLPGLSGGWEGYIRISHDDGYSHLILPKEL